MSKRWMLKVLGVLFVLTATSRVGAALPTYVYCCADDCDLVLLVDCPGGGWTSSQVCWLNCAQQ